LRRNLPDASTAVIPNAVDIDFFRPFADAANHEEMSLVFCGALNYHPNVDGLLFFLREIMPRLKKQYPALKLRVVGQRPPPAIAAQAGDGVELMGVVDDVRPHIAGATVVIAPIRIGGGTRFKILEAMAMAKPIVSTTIGAEGIDVHDGGDIVLADEPDQFAAGIARLLEDARLRRAMGAAARSLIERRYSWSASVARLEDFHAALLARRMSSP
jgi:glycosyltransferase involved in cell wall biosynthesis